MKKVSAVSLALFLCLSVIAFAQSQPQPANPTGNQSSAQSAKADKTIQGTITRVDTAGKMMTVKDTSGNETSVSWTDATKISGGSLQEGATVTLSASDKDGSLTATSIQVKGASKPY